MGSLGETQITPTHVSDKEANLFAMQLASASVLPIVLKSDLEIDLLEIIAKAGPGVHLSPSDIASRLPTHNPDAPVLLDRILRLLACYNILSFSLRTLPHGKVERERLYGLAPVAKYLVRNEDAVSIAALNLMNQDKVLMESWYYLKDAVLDGGIPFNKAYGMTAFEYHGTESKWICHDWSDEHCLKFLKNCYEALPDNGKVIVAECILPVAPDSSLATKGVVHIDVIMLAHNPGGKERTEKEFEALAKGSGFQGFQVLCCAFNTYVMEFLKKV